MSKTIHMAQIAVATDSENGEQLYGLSTDGTVWGYFGKHYSVGNLYQGRKVVRSFFTAPFWQPLDMTTEEPPITETQMDLFLEKATPA